LQAEWEAIDEEKRTVEDRIRRAVRSTFLAQRDRVQQAFEEDDFVRAEKTLTVDAVFDLGAAIAETTEATESEVREALRVGYETGLLRINAEGSFDPDQRWVRQAVRDLNAQMRNVPRNTQQVINRIILEGQTQNLTPDKIGEQIVQELDEMASGTGGPSQPGSVTRSRARRVAATSTTTAFEKGQSKSFEENGVWGAMWLSQRDGRVSPGHFEADGQVRETGNSFQVRRTLDKPKEDMAHPGDPSARASNVVNCRCSRMPILNEEDAPEDTTGLPDALAGDLSNLGA